MSDLVAGPAPPGFPEEFAAGKATFNGAIYVIYRLHVLLSDANEASRRGDYLVWKRTLDVLYREIAWCMSESERKDKDELVSGKVLPALKAWVVMAHKPGAMARLRSDELYVALSDFEIFLRDVQSKAGLVMRTSDDPRQAFKRGRG